MTGEPRWSADGAWAFVYDVNEPGAETQRRRVRFADALVLPVDAFATLKSDGATSCRLPGRDGAVSLKREFAAPIRVMVGAYERSFSVVGARGRGLLLYVLDDAACPLILQQEDNGQTTRLEAIRPLRPKTTTTTKKKKKKTATKRRGRGRRRRQRR